MSEFRTRNRNLYCENLSVAALSRRFGTPLYIYSRSAFENRYREIEKAFAPVSPMICFSIKSNGNLSVIRTLSRLGAGADIVSGGELFRALKGGIPASKVVFAGVGKTAEEIRYALTSGIHLFNVESMPELMAVNRIAGELKTRARVGLRINPDVDAHTHAKTTTGKKENKFGLPISRAVHYFREANNLKNITVAAVDLHLGSPIYSMDPYLQALKKVLSLIEDLRKNGITLSELDIGGGFGVVYHDQKPFTPAQLAAKLLPFIRKSGLKFICEPGRYITGNSGVLATQVLYVKKTDVKNFVIVDAGMNDLIRPALYNSYHAIVPAAPSRRKAILADVVGPICESSDCFGKARRMPEPAPGDILAILTAGAYGFTMSSNYISRPRACEVMVSGSRASVIRRRETYADLVRGESFAV